MNDQQASPKVLITGASGYLGGWCVVGALERGYDVRASVRNASREQELRAMIEFERGSSDGMSIVEADLNSDDGWEQAVSGCDYVLHVASPFPTSQPKDPNELIVPAREGTLRVLRAGLAAGVRRVVVTSSVAAVRNFAGPLPDRPITEQDWTDPDLPGLSPYSRSKTIAERAAWDLAREQGATERLAVVNPSAILGPVMNAHRSSSLQLVERLLAGMPGMPRLSFSVVDVRDVAELHLLAMSSPRAPASGFWRSAPRCGSPTWPRSCASRWGRAPRRFRAGRSRTPSCAWRRASIPVCGPSPATSASRSCSPTRRLSSGSGGSPGRCRRRSWSAPTA